MYSLPNNQYYQASDEEDNTNNNNNKNTDNTDSSEESTLSTLLQTIKTLHLNQLHGHHTQIGEYIHDAHISNNPLKLLPLPETTLQLISPPPSPPPSWRPRTEDGPNKISSVDLFPEM